MKILFVHQNFPGQFKHLAPALAARGDEVVAMGMNGAKSAAGIRILNSQGKYQTGAGHPWARDFDTKIIRAEASLQTAKALYDEGFRPDVIVAHPAWGEALFLKQVWPEARLGLYCEFYYHAKGLDFDFDPEFSSPIGPDTRCRAMLKNIPQQLHFDVANAGLCPTRFQADTYPEPFRSRITVIHDGIDTVRVAPGPGEVRIGEHRLDGSSELITFLSRNLEPYRGYHVFMRALPELLRRRPNARVVIVGGNEVSYGSAPPKGNWRDIFRAEVADEFDHSRVHFVGKVDYASYLQLLRVTSLHVYLTYPFVLSWSLLEAMASEAAILGSDTAPVRELITDGETGLLFPFFDTEALVDKACAMLDDPALRRRLGANARKRIQAEYDLQSVTLPRLLAWVDDLAAQAARLPED